VGVPAAVTVVALPAVLETAMATLTTAEEAAVAATEVAMITARLQRV
jgi:hypothetical protein